MKHNTFFDDLNKNYINNNILLTTTSPSNDIELLQNNYCLF